MAKNKLGAVTVKGQPELQKVLNVMVDAINETQRAPTKITAGKGIRITQEGDHWVVAATMDESFARRPLYPIIVRDDAGVKVGLTPGYVVHVQAGGVSVQDIPYLGNDVGTGTKLDTEPTPGLELSDDGDYYTRLVIEDNNTASVKFVPVEPTEAEEAPPEGQQLILNKFNWRLANGGKIADVEVYIDRPVVEDFDYPFKVIQTSIDSTTTGKVQVKQGIVNAQTGIHATEPQIIDPIRSYTVPESDELDVADGDYIWLKVQFHGKQIGYQMSRTANDGSGGVSVTVTISWTMHGMQYNGSEATPPEYLTQASRPTSTSQPMEEAASSEFSYGYIKIAKISIVDSIMKITPIQIGPAYVQFMVLPSEDSMSLTVDVTT